MFVGKILCIVALALGELSAQVATGTITGLVADSTGAAVPNAAIRIVEETTNFERSLQTDAVGNYVATRLLPGKYRVDVSHSGFQPQSKIGLVLSIDQTMRVDFAVSPGEQKQVITVVGRAEQLVESSTSSLGEVVEESLDQGSSS